MMTFKNACAAAAIALILPVTTSQSNAAPLASGAAITSAVSHDSSDVTKVYWRGRGGWGWGGVGAGLAAGALIGGAIAAGSAPYYGYGYGPYYGYGPAYAPAPVVVEPGYVGGGDDVGYCMQRYRSYDPGSGTYLGYDGLRHPCP